jgi:putative 4-mercaptohistidine N1-methyltranferase
VPTVYYESDRGVAEYLLFHFGTPEETWPYAGGLSAECGFPERLVSEGLKDALASQGGRRRALDLGCAVGRASFELARHFEEVIAIDYSHRFIEAACELQSRGRLSYDRADEGNRRTGLTAVVPSGIDRSRVAFHQGDALSLPPDLGRFDMVLAANLLCRLSRPRELLVRLADLVVPGGWLLMTTPATWLAEYTPPEEWLATGESTTFATLCQLLSAAFRLHTRRDMPFLLRTHARSFQYGIADATLWQRHLCPLGRQTTEPALQVDGSP